MVEKSTMKIQNVILSNVTASTDSVFGSKVSDDHNVGLSGLFQLKI